MSVEETICGKIFSLMAPYSQRSDSPVSYVIVEAGCECAIDADKLSDTFDKMKWDTELSAADLTVMRLAKKSEKDCALRLVSYSLFEDDGVIAVRVPDSSEMILGEWEN